MKIRKKAKRLREFRMRFTPVPKGERAYTRDPIDALGSRSKLGGSPDWDQGDETPKCRDCRQIMSFIGQIDSIEHHCSKNPHRQNFDKQQYMFGDVGMIYVFFCFDCLTTKSVFQCG